jgi:hypothetical protein
MHRSSTRSDLQIWISTRTPHSLRKRDALATRPPLQHSLRGSVRSSRSSRGRKPCHRVAGPMPPEQPSSPSRPRISANPERAANEAAIGRHRQVVGSFDVPLSPTPDTACRDESFPQARLKTEQETFVKYPQKFHGHQSAASHRSRPLSANAGNRRLRRSRRTPHLETNIGNPSALVRSD